MNDIIIKILIAAAMLDLGFSLKDLDCRAGQCLAKLQRASLRAAKIDWKPISVFPEEAVRFNRGNTSENRDRRK